MSAPTELTARLFDPAGGDGAELRGRLPEDPVGVVLVIHGGGEEGTRAMSWRTWPVVWMVPFADAITERYGDRLAVIRLKNRVKGWNEDAADPLKDAQWALQRIAEVFPGLPIMTVGHSMGGRVVLRLADHPGVAGVAALAPWIARDAAYPPAGVPVLLMHGLRDRMTSPRRTGKLAAAYADAGVDVRFVRIPGEWHTMIRHRVQWREAVADLAGESLLGERRADRDRA